jgi:chromate transporter
LLLPDTCGKSWWVIGTGSAKKTTGKVWAKNRLLNAFVRAVTAGATGAIAGAVVVLSRRSVYDLPTLLICLLSLGMLFRWRIPEPVLIACAALAGLLLHYA